MKKIERRQKLAARFFSWLTSFHKDSHSIEKYFFKVVCKLKNIFPSLHPQNILKQEQCSALYHIANR
jgi:hypothetical protein